MMIFKRMSAATLLSLLIVFIAAAQSTNEKSSVLFTVNNKPVLLEEFTYLYRKNHQRDPQEFTRPKIEEYLTLFIHYKLKVEEAFYRGLDTTETFKKEYGTYRNELLKPYLPDAKVLDSLVALTYERLKEEVKVSHILIKLKPDATPADTLKAFQKIVSLRDRVLAGENFSDLAAAWSEEPRASLTKGSLGYFTALQMVYPFEQAAYETPVGEISQPVRTQYGYHILQVEDRQPSRGEVEVSHIMVRAGDGVDDEDARNTIFDAHDKLRKGMPWQDVCEQYSEDQNTKDKGGRLKPFGVGTMASVPEFEGMAFRLEEPGDFSDPFRTTFGWHILRLESKIPLPPFEELKASLTSRVSRDERVQISRQALGERLRKELGFTENLSVKSRLFALADSSLMHGKWGPSIDKSLHKEILFTLKDHSYRVEDFIRYAEGNQAPNASQPQVYLSQLFADYVASALIQLLEERIKEQSPDYKWLLQEYYEGILLFEIMEKEIWNKAAEDTVGQRDYFKAHSKDYQAGERISGKIFSAPASKTLAELNKLLASGDSTADSYIRKNRIRYENGPFEQGDRPVLSKINWTPGLHFAENNGLNYLILIDKILPPGPKTFQEARPLVISDYQTHLENSWIKELREKFRVKVNKRVKKRAIEQLIEIS